MNAHARPSRRALGVGALVSLVAAAALGACGRADDDGPSASTPIDPPTTPAPTTAPPPAGIEHPTGPDDVVLRIAYENGFVPVEVALQDLPTVLVTGDGRLVTIGAQIAIYPGPLLPALFVQTISDGGIAHLLALADEAGLLAEPPAYTSDPLLADAPDTVVTIQARGQVFEHRAYGLGLVPDGEQDDARRALAGFVAAVQEWVAEPRAELGEAEPYTASTFTIRALETDPAHHGDPDLPPTIVEWPASASVRLADATLTCAEVPADEVRELLEQANQLTLFREAGDETVAELPVYVLVAVPRLPGTTC